MRQSQRPARVIAKLDVDGAGSAATRNAAIEMVKTEWTAFLDSDDELKPLHLGLLLEAAQIHRADMIYPWFEHPGRDDPFPGRFRARFAGPLLLHSNYIPVTVLVRTELLRQTGGFQPMLREPNGSWNDEWGLWCRLYELGAKIEHLPERTWTWHIHGGNTLGNPARGDAKP
jgi:glycosyltransferase involved in cell wall biosynthesis